MKRTFLLLLIIGILPSLVTASDSLSVYWVFFTDKGPESAARWEAAFRSISARAKIRRQNRIDSTDYPVYQPYIDSVTSYGIKVKNISKWLNGITVYMGKKHLSAVQKKSFVKRTSRLGVYIKKEPSPAPAKSGVTRKESTLYGYLDGPMEMMNVPLMHYYIRKVRNEEPGAGVRVALFDSGFEKDHPCFKRMMDSATFIGDSDFVSNDGNVAYDTGDPSGETGHGTATLSLIGGYLPDTLTGVAYAAEYMLARTEYGPTELHTEEDNWAAALEWAEAMGADIINSSLGYRYGFDFPDTSYTADDMDGQTAVVSQAAAIAVNKGMIIVNSNGNEGSSDATVNAPADVDGVLAIGAVRSDGGIAYFSSRGPTADGRIKPDLVAPGAGIYCANRGHSYDWMSGTSMAAPLAAGCAVLLKQIHPEWSAETLRNRLKTYAVKDTAYGALPNNKYGWGLVDPAGSTFGSFSVYGKISDSASGDGINTAKLMISGQSGGTYTTDSSGYYYFSSPNDFSGDTMTVLKPGWETMNYEIPAQNITREINFSLGQRLDTAVIWCVVQDEEGQLIQDASGTLSRNSDTIRAVSNSNGNLFFEDIQNGSYIIKISKSEFFTLHDTIDAPVDSVLTFTLERNLYFIDGNVIDADSTGISNVILSWTGPRDSSLNVNTNGSFNISKIEDGAYVFTLQCDGYRKKSIDINLVSDTTLLWQMEPISFSGISVYPIPCRNSRLTFEFTSDNRYLGDSTRVFYATIYSIDGYKAAEYKQEAIYDGTTLKYEADVSRLKPGMYFLYLRFGAESKRMKILIMR